MVKCLTIPLAFALGLALSAVPVMAEPSGSVGAPARIDRVPGHRAAQRDGMPVTPSPDASGAEKDGGSIGSYEDCVSNWDRGLHMTKQAWRAVCRRTHPKG